MKKKYSRSRFLPNIRKNIKGGFSGIMGDRFSKSKVETQGFLLVPTISIDVQ